MKQYDLPFFVRKIWRSRWLLSEALPAPVESPELPDARPRAPGPTLREVNFPST